MTPSQQQPELQRSTLTLYGELLCRRADWGGELVFSAFPGAAATGLSTAASLAGAASLIVDSDTDSVRAHNRDGAFDFVVTTLDEALRALKNEIRLHRPLAIALTADPSAVTHEAVERGLAPRLILTPPGSPAPWSHPAVFQLTFNQSRETPLLQQWLAVRHWSASAFQSGFGSIGQCSPTDAIPASDRIRQHWLKNLSRHQRSIHSGRQFWMWLTPEERRATGTDHPGQL